MYQGFIFMPWSHIFHDVFVFLVLERPDKVKGLHTETVACRTVVRWTPILAGSEVVSYLVRWGQSDEAYFSSSTVIFTSDPEELHIPAVCIFLKISLPLFSCWNLEKTSTKLVFFQFLIYISENGFPTSISCHAIIYIYI